MNEQAACLPGERLRYDSTHWAREQDARKALEGYLRLGDKVYNRTKLRMFMSLAGDVRGKRILDYGGGAGITAIPYAKAGANVVLVDAEGNALQTARLYAEREGVSQRVTTMQSERFPDALKGERFDIVIAKDIVEHLEDDVQLLRDVAQCQASSGMLLLSTHNSRSLNYLIEGTYQRYWRGNPNWLGWDPTHVRFYTPASLRARVQLAGYAVDRWASVYLVPYNVLSWLFLLRKSIELPSLHHLDLTLGRCFPFNRLGWNVILRGVKGS